MRNLLKDSAPTAPINHIFPIAMRSEFSLVYISCSIVGEGVGKILQIMLKLISTLHLKENKIHIHIDTLHFWL